MMDRVLFLHLHRYLTLTIGPENTLNLESKNILDNLYSEIDSASSGVEVYTSLALYRSLLLIDVCTSSNVEHSLNVLQILEKYSSIFVDSYVFGMLQIVVSLHNGNNNICTMYFIL